MSLMILAHLRCDAPGCPNGGPVTVTPIIARTDPPTIALRMSGAPPEGWTMTADGRQLCGRCTIMEPGPAPSADLRDS